VVVVGEGEERVREVMVKIVPIIINIKNATCRY
jgi:hypothetical protein